MKPQLYTRHLSSPPTIARVAPRHHPNSVSATFFSTTTSLASSNSYPSLNSPYMNVKSRHHSGRPANSSITAGSAPQCSSHELRPAQTARARLGMVDIVIGGWEGKGEEEEEEEEDGGGEGAGRSKGEIRS